MSHADEVRRNVAISCRILGMFGMVRQYWPRERTRPQVRRSMGSLPRRARAWAYFTGVHNIRRVDFTGQGPGMTTHTPAIRDAHPRRGF